MASKGGMSIPLYIPQRFIKYHRLVASFPNGCPSSVARVHDTKGGDVRRLAMRIGTILYNKSAKSLTLSEAGRRLVNADKHNDHKAQSLLIHDLLKRAYPQYNAFIEALLTCNRSPQEVLAIINRNLADRHIVIDEPGLRSIIEIGKHIGLVEVSTKDKTIALVPEFTLAIRAKLIHDILDEFLQKVGSDMVRTTVIAGLVRERFASLGVDYNASQLFEVVKHAVLTVSRDYSFKYGVGGDGIPSEYAVIVRTKV